MIHKLDYGCGDGSCSELTPDRKRYRNWLVENGGFGTYGIDIDPEKVEAAQQRVPPMTRVIMADGHETPFPDNFFDEVHVAGVLHHMCNYEVAVNEIARISKEKAKLYVLETVDNDPIFRMGRRFIGNWRGDMVMCCFTSEKLFLALSRYFEIKSVRHYWRFYLSDILLYFRKEPQLSLTFNCWVNGILQKHGLDDKWASHVVIEAERK